MRVGVVFGGRSGEHEVSLASARSVIEALDPDRFEAVPIGIARDGRWLLPGDTEAALRLGPGAPQAGTTGSRAAGAPVAVMPGEERALISPGPGAREGRLGRLDVIFPVLHGPNGEDGTIQGLLELAGLPYVGAGVLGSAVGMDKIVQKDLFVRHGLPVVPYHLLPRRRWRTDPAAAVAEVEAAIGLPCFVKPANLGSSVGISRAATAAELGDALALAARHDARIVSERAVEDARELECGVLGNEAPEASVVGEVVPHGAFYDYESKYSAGGADLRVPADLPAETRRAVRELAIRAFEVLDCAGMARVDFFLERPSGRLFVNELNTIPGFTATSMYPRLWAASGLPYRQLVTRLIDLALERHADRHGPGAG